MAALLGALAPRRTWPLVLAGVTVAALLAAGVVQHRNRCRPDEAALAAVWSPTQHAELEGGARDERRELRLARSGQRRLERLPRFLEAAEVTEAARGDQLLPQREQPRAPGLLVRRGLGAERGSVGAAGRR